MQNWNSQNKSLVTRGFYLKISNPFRFVLIFICTIIVHQICNANFLHKEYPCNNYTASFTVQKNINDQFITSEIPFQSGRSSHGADAEVEPTEDDVNHNLSALGNSSFQKFMLDELVYTSFIKSRYLHLTFSIHRQVEVPYFVLYHSWKNYLV